MSQRATQTAVEDSERIFTEIIEKRLSKVKQLIRAQEEAEVRQAEGLQSQLEEEIAGLKSTEAELKELSYTQDDILFLKVTLLENNYILHIVAYIYIYI